jgi:hypothetical protein
MEHEVAPAPASGGPEVSPIGGKRFGPFPPKISPEGIARVPPHPAGTSPGRRAPPGEAKSFTAPRHNTRRPGEATNLVALARATYIDRSNK